MPGSHSILQHSISTTYGDVMRLLDDANKVNARRKTVYYKAIFIFMSSVIEALVHLLIERSCLKNPQLLESTTFSRFKGLQRLSKNALDLEKDLWIAEKVGVPFRLESANSQSMNIFCRDNNIVTPRLFRRMEYVREKRNQIHLQTLGTRSRSYTLRMLESEARTSSMLLDRLREVG